MVNVMKAAKATGFAEKIPMFIHTATEHSTLAPLGLDAPEKVIGTSNYHFYYPDTPKNKAFAKAFKDAYGREPKVGALYGYLRCPVHHQSTGESRQDGSGEVHRCFRGVESR